MTLFAPVSIMKGVLSVSTIKICGSCGMGVECTEAVDDKPSTMTSLLVDVFEEDVVSCVALTFDRMVLIYRRCLERSDDDAPVMTAWFVP